MTKQSNMMRTNASEMKSPVNSNKGSKMHVGEDDHFDPLSSKFGGGGFKNNVDTAIKIDPNDPNSPGLSNS